MNNQNNSGMQPGSTEEKMFLAALGLVAVIIFMSLFYWLWKPEYLTLKMYQFRLLDSLTGQKIGFIHDWRVRLDNTPITSSLLNDTWSFKDMMQLSYLTDYVPVALLLLGIYAANKHITRDLFMYLKLRHRDLHVTDRGNGIDALSRIGDYVTSNGYDEIKPVWGLNLLDKNPNEGPWASARKPHEVAAQHGLFKTAGDPDTLDETKARNYFAGQLGRVYLGEESLSDYHKALLGVLLAYMERSNKKATEARRAISRSFDAKLKKHVPDYAAAIALYEQYKGSKYARHVFTRHAYVNTLMLGMYIEAKQVRKIGVCPAHYFIWLKPLDRELYYALNNEGRDVAWTECAGIFNHTRYEIAMNQPLFQPFVDECVEAFKEESKKVIPDVAASDGE